MMNTSFAVYIGIVYSYLPFMILPLYSNLEKHDQTLLEAAQDLGSGPVRAFLRITLPLSFPGIVAGSLLVFIPAVGEYVIPSLLGRTDQLMVAKLLSDEFFMNRDWPKASAVAIVMLLLLRGADHAVPALPEPRAAGGTPMKRRLWFSQDGAVVRLCLPVPADPADDGFLVQQLTPGHGLGRCRLPDPQVVPGAAQRPCRARRRLAVDPDRGDVRHRRGDPRARWRGWCSRASVPFRGRALLQGLTTAPLVMPEVITGLSMLLLFVSLEQMLGALFGWQFDRGVLTITIAHITFTMAYVTVVVQSRLASFDDSLEEAALDLGAKPAKVFFRITAPVDRACHPVRAGCWPSRSPGTTWSSRSSSPARDRTRCRW